MQVESPEKIRNLALTGHSDTGKTTLASALLYTSGVFNRLNRVEDGNAITDFDAEEIERGISIGLAPCFAPWRQHKINLLDCPGYAIFFDESRAALRAVDAALLCVSAASGIEVMTEKVWAFAEEIDLPVMIHLTKMDRERAELQTNIDQLRKNFGRQVVAIQIPVGKCQEFEGVVDLVHERAFLYKKDGDGRGKATEIPESLKDEVEEWRSQLLEAVAESDDALLEKYFEEETLSLEDFLSGLRNAIRGRKLFPVTMGSAVHGIGSSALLDALLDLMPSPLERAFLPAEDLGGEALELEASPDSPTTALVFKTLSDPFSGKLSILRIGSGTLTSDSTVWNTQKEAEERIGHLMVLQGRRGTQVVNLVTGEIGGVAKLKNAKTGDTLCDKTRPVKLAWIALQEPAILNAISEESTSWC